MGYIDRVLATNPLAFWRLNNDGPPEDLVEGQPVIDSTGTYDGVAHPEGGELAEGTTEASWLTCRDTEEDQTQALLVGGSDPDDPHITVTSSDFEFLGRDPFTVIFCLTDCTMAFIGVNETATILGTGGWQAWFYAEEEQPPEGFALLYVAFQRESGPILTYQLNVRVEGGSLSTSARIFVIYDGDRVTMWAQSAFQQPEEGAINLDPLEQADTALDAGDVVTGGDLIIASGTEGTMGIAPLTASISHVIVYDRALSRVELAAAAACEFGPVFLSVGVSPA